MTRGWTERFIALTRNRGALKYNQGVSVITQVRITPYCIFVPDLQRSGDSDINESESILLIDLLRQRM